MDELMKMVFFFFYGSPLGGMILGGLEGGQEEMKAFEGIWENRVHSHIGL